MSMTRWAARALAAALMAGLLIPSAVGAGIASTVEVQVGAPLFEFPEAGGAPADGMRFYAPTTKIHSGDTVVFNFAGFHTATLLPKNTDVQGWVADNTGGFDKPFSLLVTDPDDGADALKLNNSAGLPNPVCGAPDNPCPYNGTGVVNSGLPFGPPAFAATITGSPGDVVWAVCLVHTHMRFRMKIVGSGDEPTSQAAIDSFRDEKSAEDAEQAGVVHDKLVAKRTKHRTAAGKLVWDAFSGFDGHNWALLGMYPRKTIIRQGQTVRWHFAQLITEEHTVTLPFGEGKEQFDNSFVPSCDPDGDGGPGPDNPPDTQDPPFCNNPAQLEFDVPGKAAGERGDGVYNGDFQNSGHRGVSSGDLRHYDVKFKKTSNRKGFRYLCLIHGPFMDGRVQVKRR